jgi:sugar phosphate isomerase/epimerase
LTWLRIRRGACPSRKCSTRPRLGVEGVEYNAANWTSTPHLNLGQLLSSPGERREFSAAIRARGPELIGLNANGNQLHPTDGARQSEALHDTIRLGGELGVKTVVLMSGLLEGARGDVKSQVLNVFSKANHRSRRPRLQ